ncbi:hypothetical protein DFH11DRAFT_1691301 [Phellopilus nigrolimitatus]|nr:hypothetical protein DFH11DRAFT_1691301 [Phellopilus nigrolimitatus]
MAEFADFEGHMTRVECRPMRSSFVKTIPPKEWSYPLPSSPIEQYCLDARGLYRQENIEKRKAISLRDFVKAHELDKTFLETFDAAGHWLPRNTSAADYTPAFCATLERRYWRNCGLGKPPWYGADAETTARNVRGLPSRLSLLPISENGLPGVEDGSIVYHSIYFGAPKFWYEIPQARSVKLENTLRIWAPRDTAQCRHFLRHKSFLESLTLLAQSPCKPNKLARVLGELVLTFPRGYNAGFNLV